MTIQKKIFFKLKAQAKEINKAEGFAVIGVGKAEQKQLAMRLADIDAISQLFRIAQIKVDSIRLAERKKLKNEPSEYFLGNTSEYTYINSFRLANATMTRDSILHQTKDGKYFYATLKYITHETISELSIKISYRRFGERHPSFEEMKKELNEYLEEDELEK